MIKQKVLKYVMLYIYKGIHLKQKISKILRKNVDSPVYATPGSHLKSQFLPQIWVYMKKAISTPYQGPRSKIMSEKIEVKNLVSVSL